MPRDLDLSIVIPCWNATELIDEALDSIVKNAGPIPYEVLVIDDASKDGGPVRSRERFKNDLRFAFVFLKENIGYSKSANMLLKNARGRYLMTFDTDARLKESSLSALIRFMDRTPEAGAACGNLLNADGSFQRYYRRILTPTYYFYTTVVGRFFDKLFFGLHYYNLFHYTNLDLAKDSEMEQPPVACLIIRREALGDDSYIFDPQFRLYMLDVDLAKRVYDHGYKIFVVHDAPVYHIKTASARKHGMPWITREIYDSTKAYFKKQYPFLYPLIVTEMTLDKFLRAFLLKIIGREPMR